LAPLTISHQQFAAGLDIMEAAFAAVMGSHRAAAE
jgi:diaminobutyrate-2-oxoglutarate transaminase